MCALIDVTPLTIQEQAEVDLDRFIKHLVLKEGHYGKENAYFERVEHSNQWAMLHLIMDKNEKGHEIEKEVDKLKEVLDFQSYFKVVEEYLNLYKMGDERSRTMTSILILLMFCRIYARKMRKLVYKNQRGDLVNASFEQYSVRNLERMAIYTINIIQRLLCSGLWMNWNDFCRELQQHMLKEREPEITPRGLVLTTVLFGGIAGICWIVIRYISTKH